VRINTLVSQTILPLNPYTTELRIQIYKEAGEFGGQPTFDMAITMLSTCRQIRAEYMPLWFPLTKRFLSLSRITKFLDVFSPALINGQHAFAIRVELNEERVPYGNPVIDMQRLFSLLLTLPRVEVIFDGDGTYDGEASDLTKVLELFRKDRSSWGDWISGFESVRAQVSSLCLRSVCKLIWCLRSPDQAQDFDLVGSRTI